jgi:hypothetical protein
LPKPTDRGVHRPKTNRFGTAFTFTCIGSVYICSTRVSITHRPHLFATVNVWHGIGEEIDILKPIWKSCTWLSYDSSRMRVAKNERRHLLRNTCRGNNPLACQVGAKPALLGGNYIPRVELLPRPPERSSAEWRRMSLWEPPLSHTSSLIPTHPTSHVGHRKPQKTLRTVRRYPLLRRKQHRSAPISG